MTQRQLDALGGLIDIPGIELVWFTKAADKRRFGDLTTRATEAIIADPQQAADDFAWYRTDWHEIQAKKDGITIDPSGKSLLIRDLAKVLPVSRKQNNDGWLSGTREAQVPTAAAFGALLVRDPRDPIQRLGAGRIWQRMHLSATANGLGMQPLCQVPERIDREQSAGLPADFSSAMAAMLPFGLARPHDLPHRLPHQRRLAQPSPALQGSHPHLTRHGRALAITGETRSLKAEKREWEATQSKQSQADRTAVGPEKS